VLRKQKGFQDEIALVAPGGADAVGLSVWDLKEDAETYGRGAYPGVLKALAQVVEGTPQVQTYEVTNSTFHKIARARRSSSIASSAVMARSRGRSRCRRRSTLARSAPSTRPAC
jgi:hypothetical protein